LGRISCGSGLDLFLRAASHGEATGQAKMIDAAVR
jgi:hypothetical protein